MIEPEVTTKKPFLFIFSFDSRFKTLLSGTDPNKTRKDKFLVVT